VQEAKERSVGPGRGADAKALDRRDVAAAGRQIRAQDEEPRRALGEGDDELRALRAGEREQGRVRAAGDEVHGAVAQRVHRVERGQELDVRVEPFLAVQTELLGGERRK
jgi:hypothetical protein